MNTVFYIANYLPASVATRQSIKVVDERLSVLKDKNIIINFRNIDFISRAFADELIHYLKENRIKPQFSETNPVVAEILNTVIKNLSKTNKNYHIIPKTDIKDNHQLNLILSLL